MKLNKKNTFVIFIIFIVIITVIIDISFLLRYRRKSSPISPINVMIIVIDALRPDHLSCYGYERNTSPNIDRLAKEGARFTQAISAGGWTVESVPSILTGTYSYVHHIARFMSSRNPYIKTLSHELNSKSYHCVLWSNVISLKYLDIKDGFQRIYILGGIVEQNYKPVLTQYVLTSQIINRLRAQYKNRPFFLYIHYHGPHIPYRPPPPYKYMYLNDKYRKKPEFLPISNINKGDEKYDGIGKIPYAALEDNITDPNYYISQYDGAISYTDAQIGRLMGCLKELGLDKKTLVILTADHGEMLGEHNIYFDHTTSYEENIKVPLIIRLPKLFPKGRVVSRQVSLVAIAPTVLEVVGLNKPSYMQGESLLAFFKPFWAYEAKYAFSFLRGWVTLRARNWKLIYNNDTYVWELYNLQDDLKEQHNLLNKRPDKFKQLKQELENWEKSVASLTPVKKGYALTEDDKERLKKLGYVQ